MTFFLESAIIWWCMQKKVTLNHLPGLGLIPIALLVNNISFNKPTETAIGLLSLIALMAISRKTNLLIGF